MSLDAAIAAEREAHEQLVKAAKEALTDELGRLFADKSVMTVAWGQKYSEYNDEGMYPGIMGPALNQFIIAGEDTQVIEWEVEDYFEGLYERYGQENPHLTDPRLRPLRELLNKIGAETLAEIIGGDQDVIVAARTDASGAYSLEAVDVSY
jgi:hypothetical protein